MLFDVTVLNWKACNVWTSLQNIYSVMLLLSQLYTKQHKHAGDEVCAINEDAIYLHGETI